MDSGDSAVGYTDGGMKRLRSCCSPTVLIAAVLIAAVLIAAVLIVLLPSSCKGPPEVAEVHIGVLAPLSGPLEERVGQAAQRGVRLAVEGMNARGGLLLNGRRHQVVVTLEDSLDRPEAAIDAARKLIHRDRVIALVGPALSRNAVAAAAVAEKQRVPMISPTASLDALTAGRRYVFRATLVDGVQGRLLARFARQDLKARTAAMLYDVASAYNRSIAEVFGRVFEEEGGEVVASESYTTGESDYGSYLRRILEARPDVLLLPNYFDDVPRQVSQARRLGLSTHLLGADSWDGEVYAPRPEFEGSYFVDLWHSDVAARLGEPSRGFVEAYRRAFGEMPSSVSALFFDSLELLFVAIERAGSRSGEAIRNELASLEDFHGATGTLSYRGNGDPFKGAFIFRISRGEVALHDRVEPKGQQ